MPCSHHNHTSIPQPAPSHSQHTHMKHNQQPLASSTIINKLQVMSNAALKTATGCTQDTYIQHLYDENSYFPYTSTYSSMRHNTNRHHNTHHIHYTNIQHSHYNRQKTNMRHIHTYIVSRHLASHKRQKQHTAHTSTTH